MMIFTLRFKLFILYLMIRVIFDKNFLGKLSYILTQKGAPSLVIKGHAYRATKRRDKRTYWSCCVPVCRARCVTSDGIVTSQSGKHYHIPDARRIRRHNQIESLIETIKNV